MDPAFHTAIVSLRDGEAVTGLFRREEGEAIVLANGGLQPIADAAVDIKLLLIYVGVGCTAINFALWYYGLKHLPAASASAFQYLIPPIGVALAAAFLAEPISIWLILGTACILTGLAVTQRSLRA